MTFIIQYKTEDGWKVFEQPKNQIKRAASSCYRGLYQYEYLRIGYKNKRLEISLNGLNATQLLYQNQDEKRVAIEQELRELMKKEFYSQDLQVTLKSLQGAQKLLKSWKIKRDKYKEKHEHYDSKVKTLEDHITSRWPNG